MLILQVAQKSARVGFRQLRVAWQQPRVMMDIIALCLLALVAVLAVALRTRQRVAMVAMEPLVLVAVGRVPV